MFFVLLPDYVDLELLAMAREGYVGDALVDEALPDVAVCRG